MSVLLQKWCFCANDILKHAAPLVEILKRVFMHNEHTPELEIWTMLCSIGVYLFTWCQMLLWRWCWAYRNDRLLVNCNTNNGVERQNESFKYSYLQRHKNSSVTGMLSILIEEFLLDKYERYLIFLSIFENHFCDLNSGHFEISASVLALALAPASVFQYKYSILHSINSL